MANYNAELPFHTTELPFPTVAGPQPAHPQSALFQVDTDIDPNSFLPAFLLDLAADSTNALSSSSLEPYNPQRANFDQRSDQISQGGSSQPHQNNYFAQSEPQRGYRSDQIGQGSSTQPYQYNDAAQSEPQRGHSLNQFGPGYSSGQQHYNGPRAPQSEPQQGHPSDQLGQGYSHRQQQSSGLRVPQSEPQRGYSMDEFNRGHSSGQQQYRGVAQEDFHQSHQFNRTSQKQPQRNLRLGPGDFSSQQQYNGPRAPRSEPQRGYDWNHFGQANIGQSHPGNRASQKRPRNDSAGLEQDSRALQSYPGSAQNSDVVSQDMSQPNSRVEHSVVNLPESQPEGQVWQQYVRPQTPVPKAGRKPKKARTEPAPAPALAPEPTPAPLPLANVGINFAALVSAKSYFAARAKASDLFLPPTELDYTMESDFDVVFP
ncbi:hypothetical protein GALMADRAFT_607166 [Galerina marginata CBS 339.88]|uniref:Uncharacterized protein n=1 Tax=Galerina marginata (strain CBS 339.88) TaxID=685588 RepID=A0A067S2Q0_GALM3|nr:hypothetical protein GALMADRAFT_607166 [Galerina marginata CBS 339.88]